MCLLPNWLRTKAGDTAPARPWSDSAARSDADELSRVIRNFRLRGDQLTRKSSRLFAYAVVVLIAALFGVAFASQIARIDLGTKAVSELNALQARLDAVDTQINEVAAQPELRERIRRLLSTVGLTWTSKRIDTGENLYGVALSPDGTLIWTTGDSGSIWKAQLDPKTGSLGAFENVRESTTGGFLEDIEVFEDVDALGTGASAIAVGQDGAILVSDSTGGSWVPVAPNRNPADRDDPVDLHSVHVRHHSSTPGARAWIVGELGTLLQADSLYGPWSKVRIPSSAEATEIKSNLWGIGFARNKPIGFAVGDGTMLKTEDGGKNWFALEDYEARAGISDFAGNDLVVGPDGKKVWVVDDNGRLLVSTDSGKKWMAAAMPEIDGPLWGIDADRDRKVGLAVGWESGVIFRTSDEGKTWRLVQTSGEDLDSVRMSLDGRFAVAVGDNGLITWSRRRDDLVEQLDQAEGIEDLIKFAQRAEVESLSRGQNINAEINVINQRYQNLSTQQQEIIELQSVLEAAGDHEEGFGDPMIFFLTTNSVRIGLVGLIVFLVHLLVSLSRYYIRLAAYYYARSDALMLYCVNQRNEQPSATRLLADVGFGDLVAALSPDALNFGRGAGKTAPKGAAELPEFLAKAIRDFEKSGPG